MATIAQGVISREAGAPTRVEEMVVEDPGPGEVLVRDSGQRGLPYRPPL